MLPQHEPTPVHIIRQAAGCHSYERIPLPTQQGDRVARQGAMHRLDQSPGTVLGRERGGDVPSDGKQVFELA
ncbi:MAG: hypothetical protein H6716_24870 [Polyangiaceae bacterium]|nr:hypothetical protein [Polyangiaceae bacterium]